MYNLKDLLVLMARESAEELLLEPDQPPRMLLRGKMRVLDGPILTADEVEGLVQSIATEEQRREIAMCGDARFQYVAEHMAKFSVDAQTHDNLLRVKIRYLSP
jgi:Tfp pilus assembly ATPase PilU